mmetsp:Transcript_8099/g.20193  ORF Transcript_8099/g.20193 Transcript_8099/m.20193 type:complete len:224 (+) Transcript_8099:205-876(+)
MQTVSNERHCRASTDQEGRAEAARRLAARRLAAKMNGVPLCPMGVLPLVENRLSTECAWEPLLVVPSALPGLAVVEPSGRATPRWGARRAAIGCDALEEIGCASLCTHGRPQSFSFGILAALCIHREHMPHAVVNVQIHGDVHHRGLLCENGRIALDALCSPNCKIHGWCASQKLRGRVERRINGIDQQGCVVSNIFQCIALERLRILIGKTVEHQISHVCFP